MSLRDVNTTPPRFLVGLFGAAAGFAAWWLTVWAREYCDAGYEAGGILELNLLLPLMLTAAHRTGDPGRDRTSAAQGPEARTRLGTHPPGDHRHPAPGLVDLRDAGDPCRLSRRLGPLPGRQHPTVLAGLDPGVRGQGP